MSAILALALAAQAAGSPLRYVALGDSYSAASGVLPVDLSARSVCARSGARVAILGCPWIMPASGGCFDKMPVAQGDVPYVRGIQATLNDGVRRAAAATGATYVNLDTASNGHDACEPLGIRWVEPVLQGTNPVIVHPNALGESEMAAQTVTVLGLR